MIFIKYVIPTETKKIFLVKIRLAPFVTTPTTTPLSQYLSVHCLPRSPTKTSQSLVFAGFPFLNFSYFAMVFFHVLHTNFPAKPCHSWLSFSLLGAFFQFLPYFILCFHSFLYIKIILQKSFFYIRNRLSYYSNKQSNIFFVSCFVSYSYKINRLIFLSKIFIMTQRALTAISKTKGNGTKSLTFSLYRVFVRNLVPFLI